MAGWGGLGGPLWYAGTHSGDNGRGQPGQQLHRRGMECAEMEPEVITFNVCS